MKDTLGVLLAGGAGERLYPLTRDRAKPAVTFGGIYRIIDVTLSNCVNSALQRRDSRPPPRLYPSPVQGAVAEPTRPRRLEHHGQRDGRVHRSAAADETGERSMVPGHGRRGVSEHLLDRLRAAQA